MVTTTASLDDLRRRIDAIDDEMHDLIMRRAELVEAIAGAKKRGKVPVIRPGREAVILRRLMERHHGHFPRAALVRIWREIFSGTVAMQGGLTVAIGSPEEATGCWDLVRDHFGSQARLVTFAESDDILRAVAEGRAAVGVLPLPYDETRERWWHELAFAAPGTPRVVARLPVGGRGNARDEVDALVVSCAGTDPSGTDRSLLVLEMRGELSRVGLGVVLMDAGLSTMMLITSDPKAEVVWKLVEADGLVAAEDPRLLTLRERLGEQLLRVAVLGAYARPLSAAAGAAAG